MTLSPPSRQGRVDPICIVLTRAMNLCACLRALTVCMYMHVSMNMGLYIYECVYMHERKFAFMLICFYMYVCVYAWRVLCNGQLQKRVLYLFCTCMSVCMHEIMPWTAAKKTLVLVLDIHVCVHGHGQPHKDFYTFLYMCLHVYAWRVLFKVKPPHKDFYTFLYMYIYVYAWYVPWNGKPHKYFCKHTCTYIHAHTCMDLHITNAHTYMILHMHIHTCTYTGIYTAHHTCTYIHGLTYVYVYICIYIYAYTYIYLHRHIHCTSHMQYIHGLTYVYTYIDLYMHIHISI
jgi:hypothetical protein